VPCNDGGLAVGQVWALRHGLTPQPGPDHPPGLARPPLPGPARREAEPCA
jgi:hypothetical protein